MPWRSPSRLRSEPSAAARQAPYGGGRLLTVMMLRGYYRPQAVSYQPIRKRPSGRGGMPSSYVQMGRISPVICLLLFLSLYLALRVAPQGLRTRTAFSLIA